MTDKQDAPPLMPKFGLGDIVSITGKYAQDWCQANLMIVQVNYDHKTDLLTYSTVIAGDPLSEGMTTDWSETDFCLIERNKYNARQALTAPKVDAQSVIQWASQIVVDPEVEGKERSIASAIMFEVSEHKLSVDVDGVESMENDLKCLSGYCPDHFDESPNCQQECAMFVREHMTTIFDLIRARGLIGNAQERGDE